MPFEELFRAEVMPSCQKAVTEISGVLESISVANNATRISKHCSRLG